MSHTGPGLARQARESRLLTAAWRVGLGLLFVLSLLCRPAAAQTFNADVDDADSVVARVFSYVVRNHLRLDAVRSEVYVRHTLQTRRRNGLMRYVPKMYRLERGVRRYFGESLARYQFRPPSELVKKDIAAYSTMPYLRPSRDRWVGRYSLSVYAPNLFTDRILSPLNRRNRHFYRYTGRYCYISEGRRMISIAVRPAISNTQCVRGSFDVDASTGRVEHFDFNFAYDWARVHVSGDMGRDSLAALLPTRLLIASRLKLFGNHIDETFEGMASYDFTPLPEPPDTGRIKDRFDLTRQSLLRTDTASTCHDRTYFDTCRPYPLLPLQQAILDSAFVADSASSAAVSATNSLAPADSASVATPRRRFFSSRTEDLILDSHTIGMGQRSRLKLPPILTPSMVQWSRARGVVLQTRLAFSFTMPGDRRTDFTPRVGYSFKQRQVYWRLPLAMELRPENAMRLDIEAGGGDQTYNAQQADEVRANLHGVSNYDSLVNIFDAYDFHYYRDNRLLAMLSFEPMVGLNVGMGFRYHRRALLGWNSLAATTGMSRHLTSLAPRLHIVWTPALYYYRDGRRAVPLRSRWPTFMVDYERGLSSFGHSTRYERVEFDAQYQWPLYALRSLYFRIGGGFYPQRGADCFIDYDYFRNNYLPAGRRDELSGQFQLLDSRWYNESRHYVRLSAAYESPMLLFSRLRWLTRVVEKERLYLNLLNVDRLGFYGEAGYGLSTPLVDVAGFASVTSEGVGSLGVKIALSFFDD